MKVLPPPNNVRPWQSVSVRLIPKGQIWKGAANLLRLDIGLPDDIAPHLDFALDALDEFLGRARDRIVAKCGEAFTHVRLRKPGCDLAMDEADELPRRSCGKQQSYPAVSLDVGKAGLRHCFHIGQGRRARRT